MALHLEMTAAAIVFGLIAAAVTATMFWLYYRKK